jgi:large subunit ribosomal protein L15
VFLHEVKKAKGSRKIRKIVGRGSGSGHGKTSGRGHNGQKSRSGRAIIHGSEGGQMSLIRRLPKVGFRRRRRTLCQLVSLCQLSRFKDGDEVTLDSLLSIGLIKNTTKPVKILATGEIKKPLILHAHFFSQTAQEKIVSAGGKIIPIKKN